MPTLDFQSRLLEAIERNTEAQLEAAKAYRELALQRQEHGADGPREVAAEVSMNGDEFAEIFSSIPEGVFRRVTWSPAE